MNSETCERLYNTYYMRVFSYVMTLSGDRHTSEEITQEAFFRAFSKTASFRNESDEVTWLCAIAKNCFVDETRRRNKTAPIPEELPAAGKVLSSRLQTRIPPSGSTSHSTRWMNLIGKSSNFGFSVNCPSARLVPSSARQKTGPASHIIARN